MQDDGGTKLNNCACEVTWAKAKAHEDAKEQVAGWEAEQKNEGPVVMGTKEKQRSRQVGFTTSDGLMHSVSLLLSNNSLHSLP